ncbi:MAG: exo-alpha-sialidase [Proteobacteria bacterium]|nr:exo-alpha-sialidase [Pseudomonadota bacterium]
MSINLVVGTPKGAAVLKSETGKDWTHDFVLRGWPATASVRDDKGRTYIAVNSPNYGVALFASEDMKEWKQLEAAPRYRPTDRGNPEHHRLIAKEDFGGLLKGGGRFVDQIWNLHFAHGALFAGVSEAGLFTSRDYGGSWQPIDGFNEQPGRESWAPGFGGLGCHTILTDAKDPNRIWAGISAAGFFRSDDGGKTWSPKNKGVDPAVEAAPATTGQCVHSVVHDPKNADVMIRQEHRGVHRSTDGGDSWQVMEDGLPVTELSDGHHCSFGFASAIDIASDTAFVIPLDGDNFRFPRGGQLAVYRSRKGGKWEPLTKGLPADCYTAILRGALSADQKGGLYFGTASGAVYASDDLGESWREIASGLPRIMSVEAYAS